MEGKQKYSHVIWDWNGTLFDDVDWCVSVIDSMLRKRQMRVLGSVEEYHKVFGFPIVDYYRRVGFDFREESFDELADEYIRLYHSERSGNCKLHENAEAVLEGLQERQIRQVILSASEVGNLMLQMSGFHIQHYFEEILGLSDIYAASKIDVGRAYLSGKEICNAVLIGDTAHDFEVAKALGVECLLIARGHQSREQLLVYEVPVLDDISQVIEYVR